MNFHQQIGMGTPWTGGITTTKWNISIEVWNVSNWTVSLPNKTQHWTCLCICFMSKNAPNFQHRFFGNGFDGDGWALKLDCEEWSCHFCQILHLWWFKAARPCEWSNRWARPWVLPFWSNAAWRYLGYHVCIPMKRFKNASGLLD